MDGAARRSAVVRIVGAALVGCLAVLVAVCGLIGYAATSLDRVHESYERELVERRLARSLERMGDDVLSASVWNDAVEAVARNDQAWMQANFGDYYADYMGHELTVLVAADSRGLYASRASEPVATAEAVGLASAAEGLVAGARMTAAPHFGLEAARPQQAILMLEGAPWLVVAAPLLAEDREHYRGGPVPPVMVSARPVAALLPDLQRDLGLQAARLSSGDPRTGEAAAALPGSGAGGRVIVWTPKRPGVRLVLDAAPYLVLALFLLAGALLTGGLKVRGLLHQLAASENDLQTSLAEAERANAAKSQFLANMSHELRTPLNGVVAMAELLEARQTEPEARDMARTLMSSGRMLRAVVDDVLDIARIEAGRLTLDQRPFHLGDLAASVADLHAAAAAARGIALRCRVSGAAHRWFAGDANRITQILSNLIGNAVKFTEAGRVELRARRDARGVVLVVADTGLGFDRAAAAHLFRPFEQADASISRRFGGTGLGLAISRDLIEAMGGTIHVRSRPGRGAAFRVRLPLQPTDAPAQATAASAPAVEATGLRVLCVDDHPVNRRVVELILNTAGASVTMAGDGEAALEAFATSAFDVILMDLQMPVMDGLTAIRQIRAAEARQGLVRTPVIALTANGMPGDIAASGAAGADCHLTKPISPAALLAAIDRVRGGKPGAESAVA